jgi:hypothetical protein
MPGVPRKLAEHRIDVNEGSKPVNNGYEDFHQTRRQQLKRRLQN